MYLRSSEKDFVDLDKILQKYSVLKIQKCLTFSRILYTVLREDKLIYDFK